MNIVSVTLFFVILLQITLFFVIFLTKKNVRKISIIIIYSLILIGLIFTCAITTNKYHQEYEPNLIENKQNNFRQTLEDMKQILDTNNIPYHLDSGTALGAIREQRFISHDEDIDIAIFHKDRVSNLESIVTKNGKFELIHKLPEDNKNENEITEFSFKHLKTRVKIDIFFIVEEKDQYISYSYFGECDDKPKKRCEYVNSKYKLNDIIFYGKKYKVPEEKFLEEQYGKDWKTPKKFSYIHDLNEKSLQSRYPNLKREFIPELTIGIKTFCRPEALNQTLLNICNYHLQFNILIADDSDNEYKKQNEKVIEKYKQLNNIHILKLPFDSGLSYSRNQIVSNCKTKYVMILDDSRYFTNNLPILKMIKFLDNTNYDLFCGVVKGRSGIHKRYTCLFDSISKDINNNINITCKKLKIIKNNFFDRKGAFGEINLELPELFETNIGLNTFIATVDSLKNTKWKNKLKLGEHEVFFYDYYKKGYKCVFSPDVIFNQVNESNKKYSKYYDFRKRKFIDSYEVNINFKD
jgi:phosphorylcholine metabolism protein LicD